GCASKYTCLWVILAGEKGFKHSAPPCERGALPADAHDTRHRICFGMLGGHPLHLALLGPIEKMKIGAQPRVAVPQTGKCRPEARRYASHFTVRVTRHFISLVRNRLNSFFVTNCFTSGIKRVHCRPTKGG